MLFQRAITRLITRQPVVTRFQKPNVAAYFSTINNKPATQKAGPVTWASLALAGVVGSGLVYYYNTEKDRMVTQSSGQKVKTVGKALVGGPWTLVDSESCQPITSASLKGGYTLLYFGFTRCPDICPNELVRIGQVVETLKQKHKKNIAPVFITVDPTRDTIEQMNAYRGDFHPSFRWLTGTPDQVETVTKAFRVYFSKADVSEDLAEEEYLVDHSIVMYLMDPEGEFVDFFTQSATVEDIVAKINNSMAEI